MGLSLSLLGLTNLQAAVAIANYTLVTNIDPAWVSTTAAVGSPFTPKVTTTLQSVTVPDGQGDAPKYTGNRQISYNRVGFQQAFGGWNLRLRMALPFTYGDVVAALKAQVGIVLEQQDIQNHFSTPVTPDESGNVNLKPAAGSLKFYIDFSPFMIVVNINTAPQTELDRLIAMTQMADIQELDAANAPPPVSYPPASPPLDQST